MQKVVRPAAKRTKRKLEPELDDESPESPESPLPDVLTPDRDTPTPVASTSATQEPTPPLAPVSEPTRQMLFDEIDALRRERDEAIDERDQARARLNSTKLSSSTVADDDDKCRFYTGLTWAVFIRTFHYIASSVPMKGIPTVPPIDQFFYMLVKLKHGLRCEYLADQIGIPESTLIDHFWKWLDATYIKLHFLIKWPDRDFIFGIIPPAIKKLFPRLTGIIDCFEIFVEAPSNLKARAQVWSSYKRHTTMKFLISCNPLGAIHFLSKAWGGDVSVTLSSLTRVDFLPASHTTLGIRYWLTGVSL